MVYSVHNSQFKSVKDIQLSSMAQRYDYNRPNILQIDLNQATYQAFLNCINRVQGLETESTSMQGVTSFASKVSIERFVTNIGVLDGIIGKKDGKKPDGSEVEWTAGEFDQESDSFQPFKYWAALVKYLKDVGFFKQPRREAHI